MEINGLPLHPLLVHAAVVFGPLAALVGLGYALVPRWRDRLRQPTAGLAVVAGLCVTAAYVSGRSFLDSRPELAQVPAVGVHEDRAWLALWATLAFSVVGPAAVALDRRPGAVRVTLRVLLAGSALATLVLVVLTGDAGSRAVWG